MTDNSSYLRQLKKKYLAIRSGELLLFSLGTSSIVFSLANLFNIREPLSILLPVFICIAFFCAAFFISRPHRLKEGQLISFINHNYPVMQQSADLLLMDPSSLTSLQRIQQEKIQEQFKLLYKSVRFPNRLRSAGLFLTVSMVLTVAVYFFIQRPGADMVSRGSLSSKSGSSAVELPASIREITVKVTPPAYTRLPDKQGKDRNLIVVAGSVVTWSIVFSDSIRRAQLIFSGGDSVSLTGAVSQTFKRSFSKSTFYQISWQTASGLQKSSEHYKVEVIGDQPPKILVPDQPPFVELDPDDQLSFDLKSDISDDYGLADAYIIATVSKGTGESVKFREEKLRFTLPDEIRGRKIHAVAKIDLLAMTLAPGDELYFYVEGVDIKTPSPNLTRTETFFVALRDTASENFAVDPGMGADLMPEYFRSQRQIIIDSEKLLRDKRGINAQTFSRRSNELGYDQKMLRLKYGEFLGEEFETTIGPAAEPHSEENGDDAESEDPLSQYTHRHDTDNEHNLVPEKSGPAHDRQSDSEENEDPIEAYRHVHDDPEEATFFTESIRAKLKAALTVMWDAELHLRLSAPQKSLPYQYKALKLLKEISEASRIYVHKTGFDPPPLKEDKRLTGDLSEIRNSRHQTTMSADESYPEIRFALSLVEQELQQTVPSLTTADKDAIFRAGTELAARALQEPGKYLQALAAMNSLNNNDEDPVSTRSTLIVLRKAFWTALPRENISPVETVQGRHALDKKFVETMQSLKR